MKKAFLAAVLSFFLPAVLPAAQPALEQPRWSLEVKGGRFTPALDDWSRYYGKSYMNEYQFSLAYKMIRQVEAGASFGWARAKGHAYAPAHDIASGEVSYELMPVNVFILARGMLREDQWFVPYLGGGLTRIYYRESVEGQGTARGSADGYHARAGVQLSLDGVDPGASNSMYVDYGIRHTFFFLETEYTRAMVKSVSVDLGGTAFSAGLLFEF